MAEVIVIMAIVLFYVFPAIVVLLVIVEEEKRARDSLTVGDLFLGFALFFLATVATITPVLNLVLSFALTSEGGLPKGLHWFGNGISKIMNYEIWRKG